MKSKAVGFRLSVEELEDLHQLMTKYGLDPNKDKSKFLRGLMRSEQGLLTLPKDDIELLKYHYKNISRVGGLLNQYALVLNSQYVDAEGGKRQEIKVDKQKVIDLVEKVEAYVQDYKKTLLEITGKARLK